MFINIEDAPSWIEITGIKKYANVNVGNNKYIDIFVNIIDR